MTPRKRVLTRVAGDYSESLRVVVRGRKTRLIFEKTDRLPQGAP